MAVSEYKLKIASGARQLRAPVRLLDNQARYLWRLVASASLGYLPALLGDSDRREHDQNNRKQ